MTKRCPLLWLLLAITMAPSLWAADFSAIHVSTQDDQSCLLMSNGSTQVYNVEGKTLSKLSKRKSIGGEFRFTLSGVGGAIQSASRTGFPIWRNRNKAQVSSVECEWIRVDNSTDPGPLPQPNSEILNRLCDGANIDCSISSRPVSSSGILSRINWERVGRYIIREARTQLCNVAPPITPPKVQRSTARSMIPIGNELSIPQACAILGGAMVPKDHHNIADAVKRLCR